MQRQGRRGWDQDQPWHSARSASPCMGRVGFAAGVGLCSGVAGHGGAGFSCLSGGSPDDDWRLRIFWGASFHIDDDGTG